MSRVGTRAIKIEKWMDQMQLKMNDNKTEFIIFSSRRQPPKTITKHLNVNSSEMKKIGLYQIFRCPSRQKSVTQETHSYQMQNCHVQPSLHQEH